MALLNYELISKEHITQWLFHVNKIIKSNQYLINSLDYDSQLLPESRNRLNLLKRGYEFKLKFYAQLKSELIAQIERIEDIYDYDFNDSFFPFSFKYLIKDWNKKSNETQAISKVLQEQLETLNIKSNGLSAIFFGCGSGRLVVDMADSYHKIDAFDKSLPGIWSIYYLINAKKWKVTEIVEKNCRRIEDSIQTEEIAISDYQIKTISKKINFFVADILQLESGGKTYDHIYSVYFTDVLPLKLLFKKVDSLLNPNGVFIHYGPLDYFFTNVNEMLSAEEIELHFKRQGYKILASEYVSDKYLHLKNSMSSKEYDNWLFIAQKDTIIKEKVSLKSLLALSENAHIKRETTLNHKFEEKDEYQIICEGDIYSLPQITFDVIMKSSLNMNLGDIMAKIGYDNLNTSDEKRLLEIFQELLDKGFLIKTN